MSIKVCNRCVMDSTIKVIDFDKKGVCIGELIESLNNDTSHSQN